MDTSYLSSQVSTIIDELHGLFDEIGVPSRERESRESELFAALSETLHNQVRLVATEKDDLTEEAHRIITTIKQMEASLEDDKAHLEYESDDDLKVTYPLMQCLQGLKEKHKHISKLHKERFEQVKKLVQALESYSSHLEPSYIQIELPPTSPDASVPPTFDLSNNYVSDLDDEFTRVYEEYNRRVALVKGTAENIIQLWAELGTPQAQTDSAIVKYYRDAPEQLGLHEDDISRLRMKQSELLDEKKGREKRLRDLRTTVEAFNRGCGMRQINEFEDELSRLNELKRQNLHLFVEDARYKLQELWDGLYFSEEEMLEFTPAFSDVYSDALLEAHEQEIERLEALKEQRAPTLALIDEHQSLVKDRDDLQASSQDASRLMMRGQKGEKRDPTRLLREEKMRKRIAKDLPKIAAKLRKVLEDWEEEYGRPFMVHGEPYLDKVEVSEAKPAPGPRRSNSAPRPTPPNRSDSRTPTAGGTLKRHQSSASVSAASESRQATSTIRGKMGPPPSRAPPPKMRDLFEPPPPAPSTQTYYHRNESFASSGSSVRPISPEDVFEAPPKSKERPQSYQDLRSSTRSNFSQSLTYGSAPPASSRQHSMASSSANTASGSENWETYGDVSETEPEEDPNEDYFARLRAARANRFTPDDEAPQFRGSATVNSSMMKKQKGYPLYKGPAGHVLSNDRLCTRIVSGSEANWTDEDAF
ncbi:hypothetical protein EYC80_008835 [Monilinia laxa]|uniref:Microtubule associated protein n=1 Tax=Monilinia laxa TaxID=61186 RepID=A0A5N6K1W8_MONLA|nr:hypothetical protein EYC80_008835 [Monilinia laxa]